MRSHAIRQGLQVPVERIETALVEALPAAAPTGRHRTETGVELPHVDLASVGANLASIATAFLLALPLGWERERAERSAGLRTFPLVAMASCGYILIARAVLGDHPDGQARVIQGLMTGIGFIGGGAILKGDGTVRGTATAASIWNTGAIGAAAALGSYEIAVVLSVVNLAALRWLRVFKQE